jgi:hypothetical protein
VNGQHLFPLFERIIDDGADDLDAGVADQHVDAAEVRGRIGHALVDLLFAGDVHGDGKCLPPDCLISSAVLLAASRARS